jgi:hypothetical protein
MQARDGPEITQQAPVISPVIDTGISSQVKPAKLTTSRPRKTVKKPPTVSGYNWKSDSSGFALRKAVYVTDPDTGIRKRKLPRIGHLSKSAFGELKRKNKGASLERAIAEWIAAHDRP